MLRPVTSVALDVRIQARLAGNGLCHPVTTKLCPGVDLKKVLDGKTFSTRVCSHKHVPMSGPI